MVGNILHEMLQRSSRSIKSSFWHFLIPYVIVLAVPVIIVSIIYTISAQIVEEEVHRSSSVMLEQAKQVIDARFKEVDDLAVQISWNPRIHHFMYSKQPFTQDDRYKAIVITNDLKFYNTSNRFISDFYIYFKNSNVIMNKQSRYEPRFFYENIYSYRDQSYEEWYRDILNCYHGKEYLPSAPMVFDNREQRNITYMQSIPFDEKTYWLGTLVVLIKEDNIKQLLRDIINPDTNGLSYVIGPDNRVITRMGSISDLKPLSYGELMGDNNFIVKQINNRNMIISYATSAVNKWKYVTVVPFDIYMAKASVLRSFTFKVSAFLLVLGLLTASILAYRDYIPIREITDTITRKRSGNFSYPAAVRDYSSIKQVLEQAMEESNSFRTQIPTLKAGLLTKLVKGEIADFHEGSQFMDLLGLHFETNVFGVILVLLDEVSGNQEREGEVRIVQGIANDIVFQAAFPDLKLYAFSLDDDKVAVLCNFVTDRAGINSQALSQIADQLAVQIGKECNVAITSGISNLCYDMSGIHECYQQALMALSHRVVKGRHAIIRYDEIKTFGSSREYHYPLEVEARLLNMVKSGDLPKVYGILDEIYRENFVERHLSPPIVRCLMFDIMSTTIKCLYEIDPQSGSGPGERLPFKDGFDPVNRLSRCETVEELYVTIKHIYSTVCDHINRNKKSHNIRRKEEILEYIHEHYQDKNICLNMVADHFGLAPAYLSRFFKEQVGENFMDYLNNVRLKKAMQLLKSDSRILISQVAEEVGYTNANALIRLFKKYKGVTPSEYREQPTVI